MLNKYKYWIYGGLIGASAIVFYNLLKGKVLGAKADNWSNSPDFFTTSKGINLSALGKKVGITLSRNKGIGSRGFDANKYKSFKSNPKVFWAIYNIDSDTLIASSSNATKNVYGASVPKVLVASAAIAKNNGVLPNSTDYSKFIQLLVKSNNDVWTPIQNLAGGGSSVNAWAKSMGYKMQPARSMGNNANAVDMCKFWTDVCKDNFQGAEVIYRITSSCQTSGARSRKYMPTTIYIGGKTGTYMSSNHDSCWIEKDGKFYAITVLTELGSSGTEAIAQMFRGLYNEYIG